jgi:hypothetical protein
LAVAHWLASEPNTEADATAVVASKTTKHEVIETDVMEDVSKSHALS